VGPLLKQCFKILVNFDFKMSGFCSDTCKCENLSFYEDFFSQQVNCRGVPSHR